MPIVFATIVLTLIAQAPPRNAAPPTTPKGTAVVRGRVVAPGTGRPVAGASVSFGVGFLVAERPRFVSTDASGKFEFTDVEADTSYWLVAVPASYQKQFLPADRVQLTVANGQTVEGLELVLRPAGVIVGRLVDDFGQPVGAANVSASPVSSATGIYPGYAQSDEFGRFRVFSLGPGGYYLSVRASGTVDPNARGSQGLLETYYPGTPSRGEAKPIDVRGGEETDVGELSVLRGRYLRVRGMVLDAQGVQAPSNRTTVSLSCKDTIGVPRSIDAQGRFDFLSVPPGTCRIEATMRKASGQGIEQYVSQSLTFVDDDTDVRLAMKATAPLTGRVVFERQAPVPSGSLTVRAERADRLRGSYTLDPAPVTSDLTFTLPGVTGQVLLRIQGAIGSTGVTLKAVMRGEEDVTDIPTEFKADDNIRVIVAPMTSGVQGTVTTDAGKPAVPTAVLLFSEDRRTWVPLSTRVQATRTYPGGRFMIRAPPGRYHLVALPLSRSIRSPNEIDASVLEPLVKEATTVVVLPNEVPVIDLRVSGGGGY